MTHSMESYAFIEKVEKQWIFKYSLSLKINWEKKIGKKNRKSTIYSVPALRIFVYLEFNYNSDPF